MPSSLHSFSFDHSRAVEVTGVRRMNRTKMLMGTPLGGAILVGLLCLTVLTLSGCAEPAAIAAVPPTSTVYAPPPTQTPHPPLAPTPAPLEFPLVAPSLEPAEVPDDSMCVNCHTSERTLQALAEEEEVAETLSEGEG